MLRHNKTKSLMTVLSMVIPLLMQSLGKKNLTKICRRKWNKRHRMPSYKTVIFISRIWSGNWKVFSNFMHDILSSGMHWFPSKHEHWIYYRFNILRISTKICCMLVFIWNTVDYKFAKAISTRKRWWFMILHDVILNWG